MPLQPASTSAGLHDSKVAENASCVQRAVSNLQDLGVSTAWLIHLLSLLLPKASRLRCVREMNSTYSPSGNHRCCDSFPSVVLDSDLPRPSCVVYFTGLLAHIHQSDCQTTKPSALYRMRLPDARHHLRNNRAYCVVIVSFLFNF